MQFEDKKLLPEAIEHLFQCPIESVHPYTLMLAPVYIFMKRNEKFVSVKAPLDFFTPDELERLKQYEVFYLPKFVKASVRYQTAAHLLKSLFEHRDEATNGLIPTPYEVSNETLKIVGRLWGKELKIEPFFMSVFAHELCGQLDPDCLLASRETAVARHDWGLLLSGAFVFIAVHLGHDDLQQLKKLRNQIYERTVSGENWEQPASMDDALVCDLNAVLKSKKELSIEDIENIKGEWARRLLPRLSRIKKLFARTAEPAASIYGDEGFLA